MPWVEEKVDPELVEIVKEFDKKHKSKLLALLAKVAGEESCHFTFKG